MVSRRDRARKIPGRERHRLDSVPTLNRIRNNHVEMQFDRTTAKRKDNHNTER